MDKITVNDIITKLKSGELENPSLLSDYVVILSAHLHTASIMELELRINYARKWAELRADQKTDKSCDMAAQLTEEYKDWQKAQIHTKTIIQCIQSLKKKLQNLSDELRSAQNYG